MTKQSPLRMIGAIAPSSYWLAHAMTRFVENASAINILEVGAGTGAITSVLLKKMQKDQHLDVVEILPQAAALLRGRFGQRGSVTIHCDNIISFEPKTKFDLIICSLPFNAFLPEEINAVFEKLKAISNHLAIMSFFEYKIIQKALLLFFNKVKFQASRLLIEQFISQYQFDEETITFNIPPAVVHHLCINKTNSSSRLGV